MATRMVRLCLAATCVIPSLSLLFPPAPARADGIATSYCFGTVGAVTCTSQWQRTGGGQVFPWQVSARETAASAEREKRWLARCRPTARQDQFGVTRLSYAASGCEFGKTED